MRRDLLIAAGVVILVLSAGAFFRNHNQTAPMYIQLDAPIKLQPPPTPAKF